MEKWVDLSFPLNKNQSIRFSKCKEIPGHIEIYTTLEGYNHKIHITNYIKGDDINKLIDFLQENKDD
jgi:hypothetical protein